nr:MAG TPA: hypothetical protein [Caudoviricetes sp.]
MVTKFISVFTSTIFAKSYSSCIISKIMIIYYAIFNVTPIIVFFLNLST